MQRAKQPFPTVIDRFVEAMKQAAKDLALHGVLAVYQDDRFYYVVSKIPRGETVMSKSVKR